MVSEVLKYGFSCWLEHHLTPFPGLKCLKYMNSVTGTLSILAFCCEKLHSSAEQACTLDYISIVQLLEKLNFSLVDLKAVLFHQNGSKVLSLYCFQNVSNTIYQSWNKIFQWGENEMSQWELTENVDKIDIFLRNVFMLSHQYFVWNIFSLGPWRSIHQNYFDSYFSLLKHPIKKVYATKCIILWFSILDFISCQQCRSLTFLHGYTLYLHIFHFCLCIYE